MRDIIEHVWKIKKFIIYENYLHVKYDDKTIINLVLIFI
jgi:hypothetical protein